MEEDDDLSTPTSNDSKRIGHNEYMTFLHTLELISRPKKDLTPVTCSILSITRFYTKLRTKLICL